VPKALRQRGRLRRGDRHRVRLLHRLEESPAAVHVNMRHGAVSSLTDTASGRLFAAALRESAGHVSQQLGSLAAGHASA
jgi:DNA-binding IclR family transcriptional regulator